MSELSQADRCLLEQIRAGGQEGWSQLVSRYQGRLLAFARAKMPRSADAEDLVQDTFISFLRGLSTFREEAGLESYLFTILRRKIITWFRGRPTHFCLIQDVMPRGHGDDQEDATEALAGREPTASWYARREEQCTLDQAALAGAMRQLVEGYKRRLDFHHLRMVELLFFAGYRNKAIAELLAVPENKVALCKHRCLHELRRLLVEGEKSTNTRGTPSGDSVPLSDALLTHIWQTERISCLKRGTIGAYLLDTLDDEWRDYVTFHLERLGCAYCRANLTDLREQSDEKPAEALRQRIFQSTIGFLTR